MSHELTETDQMAYVGATPWHGLGVNLPEGSDLETMAQAAGLNWRVDKRKLRVVDGRIINDHFGLVRSDSGETLDVVGKQYVPTQPREALEFFEKFSVAGEMSMETAGSLCGGRWVWGLAKINGSRFVTPGDEIRNYVLLVSPNVHGKSLVIKQTSIRVVCWNTMTAAINHGEASFRMRHTKEFDANVREEAALIVANATGLFNRFVDGAARMAEVTMPRDASMDYLKKVFRLDDDSLKVVADDEKKARRSPMLTRFETALATAPGAQIDGAKDTLWGAFNAVTYLCDHTLGRDVDTRLRESWLGYRENVKQRALKLAEELV